MPFHELQIVPALDYGVYKSDTLIPGELKTSVQVSLERIERNDHYLSNIQSDTFTKLIIDPSVCPLQIGRTKYLSSAMTKPEDYLNLCGRGKSMSQLRPGEDGTLRGDFCYNTSTAWSTRYQWLPCDVCFDKDTSKAR